MSERRNRTNQVINFNPESIANAAANTNQPDSRIPVGSDYDLDKVNVVQTTAVSSGISFGDICASMIELHDKKNADYGDAFTKSMDIFGTTYLLSRLHDKLQRLISINDKGTIQVTNETMFDTLMDLACYAIMGIEYYQNTDKR